MVSLLSGLTIMMYSDHLCKVYICADPPPPVPDQEAMDEDIFFCDSCDLIDNLEFG